MKKRLFTAMVAPIFILVALILLRSAPVLAGWPEVTVPSAGEIWVKGVTYTIQWINIDTDNPLSIELCTIEDDNDGYGEYFDCYNSTIIAQNVPNGDDGSGSYSWTVPGNLTNRTNYVIAVDDMYSLYGGGSDEFTISGSGGCTGDDCEPPVGNLIDLEDYNAPIWDLSGTDYNGVTLIQDANGKVTGSGTINYLPAENNIFLDVEIKGKVKGKDNIVTLKLSAKGEGYGYISGEYADAKLKDKVTLQLNKSSGALVGTRSRKVCADEGVGCDSTTEEVSFDVPDGMTGDAELEIAVEIDEKGKKLEGDATLTLSNGDIYNLSAKGKYNSKKEETKYSLKGSDEESKAVKVKLTIDEGSETATAINAKVLGQKLQY